MPGITSGRLHDACGRAAEACRGALEPAPAIEAALDALHEQLDGALVVVLMLEHGRLWLVGSRGYPIIPAGLPTGEGVVGRAVREAAPQLVRDVKADPDYIETAAGIVSELAVPLVTEDGTLVGVIDIETFSELPGDSAMPCCDLAAVLARAVQKLGSARQLDLSSLARLFVHLSSLRDPASIADLVVRSLPRLLAVETSQLLLRDDSGPLSDVARWRASEQAPAVLSPGVLEALRQRVDSTAVFEQLDHARLGMPEITAAGAHSAVLLPLRASGQEIGLLVGTSRSEKTFDRRQAEATALLAAHTAASLDAALALGRERRSAATDPLTGLLNRRGLEERLERELDLAQAERRPLSLIVLDCDDFKDVNDRAGHEFGDVLLREIGDLLGALAAEVGCAGRLGGDEFVVMLPGTDAELAQVAAEDVQARLGAGLDEAGFPLHLSAGVSTYPYDGAGATQLMRSADQALYEAKARGKDTVVCFRELVRRGGTEVAAGEAAGAGERRRAVVRPDASKLESTMEAAAAIWATGTPAGTFDRLAKSLAFVVGAIAAQVSRIEGDRLVDIYRHKLRDIDIGDELAYLIDEFPVTKRALETGVARSISFLDEDLDPAEAFVLREVQMNCCLLLPLHLHGAPWGLVELYDMRLRNFTDEDQAVAEFLVQQAARRLEAFGQLDEELRQLPLFRLQPPLEATGST